MTEKQFGSVSDSERPYIIKCYNFSSIMCVRLLPIFDYDFLFHCPSLMHSIGILYGQHFQTMLEHGVYELAYSSFHFLFDINL